MRNEMGDQTRWGAAETYDLTRKPTKGKRYYDKGRNGPRGTFLNRYNRDRRVNNCAENGEEMYNGDNVNGDRDTAY